MTPTLIVPRQRQGQVRQEGDKVQIIVEGQLVLQLTWDSALELAKQIHHVAKLAEEEAKAEQVIFDQAILQRLGAPVGLVTRQDMALEAAKEAAWNTPLRRYIRKSEVNKHGLVYAPRVYHQRKKD